MSTDASFLELHLCQLSKIERTLSRETTFSLDSYISVDHFICSTRGRLLTSTRKTKRNDMYTGECIFVDHASGFILVEHQVNLTFQKTLKAKESSERMCCNTGVTLLEYLANNSKAFIYTSADVSQHRSHAAGISC